MPDSGYAYAAPHGKGFLIGRIKKTGAPLWSRQIIDTNAYIGFNPDVSLVRSSANCIYVTRYGQDSASVFTVVHKLDANGNAIWTKAFGRPNLSQSGRDIFFGNNSLFISGEIKDSTYMKYYFIQKLDTNGNLQWGKTLTNGSSAYETYCAAAMMNNTDIVIAGKGSVASSSGTSYFCMFRVDGNGNMVANNTFFSSTMRELDTHFINEDSKGNIFTTGYYEDVASGGSWDISLVKLDSALNFRFGRYYGGSDYDEGWAVFENKQGNFNIVAEPESFGNVSRLAFIQTDSLGNLQWTRLYGDASGDFPNSAVANESSGYSILAKRGDFPTPATMYLLKVDSMGFSACPPTTVTIPSGTFTAVSSPSLVISNLSPVTSFTPVIVNYPITVLASCLPLISYENNQQDESLTIFPNPSHEKVFIKNIRPGGEKIRLEVDDVLGKTIFRDQVEHNDYDLDIRSFPDGIYFIKISGNTSSFVRKIIKN